MAESATATTTTTTSTTPPATLTPPVLPSHVKKPNEEEHKKALAEVNARIDKLQKQMDAVKEKISKLPGKSDNTRREELRAQLAEVREKQAEIKKGKQAVYEQLDALNESIRKKVGNIKGLQSKVPYKTVAEVDERISELESKIESGVRIVEEKKMLQEISLLKRNRNAVEGLDEQQEAINKERAIYDGIRKNIDTEEAKKLSEQFEKAMAELNKINADQAQQREQRNKLYDERTRIKGLLDEEYNQLRSMRDEHRKANDEYYTFIRQLREYKREQEKVRKAQEEEEKRKEAAKQELELASLPAFEHEITLCDNLGKFLQSFLNKGETNGTASAAANNEEDAKNAATGGRAIEAPDGVALVKKSDREENYFVGSGKKKGKGGSKKNANAASSGATPVSDTLKLPLATMEGFFEVKVTVPTKISDIPSTLEKLQERKAYYLAEQPRVTEENKKKAQEKIDAMLKA
ncbi:related to bfr1-nuclear segregation protein [Lichtheimia corymbifera JMRC:FSU:9682]|uniref:Related to bfr1-nuclear segregation protein n=1 Tax=Lichtheimia corymbifera JMRC:FSU:9682 TaxID=1263082 RepID=A0A068S7B5_9FUNG|nr:related to bfr1-nuclear segregation protein [Lichtheimia corymbifera JMRC:FSU:9682]